MGHINRGAQINSISYRPSDLNLSDRYPNVLVKKYSDVQDVEPNNFLDHEFTPRVEFPLFINNILSVCNQFVYIKS